MNNVQSAPNSGAGSVAVGVGVGIKTARSNIFNVDGLPQQMAPMSVDYSSIRGKDVLVQPTDEQMELLQKRLQDRIADNCGETIYEIGVGEGEFFPKMTGCFQKHHS